MKTSPARKWQWKTVRALSEHIYRVVQQVGKARLVQNLNRAQIEVAESDELVSNENVIS